jgi:hypothetical protein
MHTGRDWPDLFGRITHGSLRAAPHDAWGVAAPRASHALRADRRGEMANALLH